MSLKTPKTLVLDASVARASGDDQTISTRARRCRDTLREIRKLGYFCAMNRDLLAEWHKHESSTAKKWRREMTSQKRLILIEKRLDDLLDLIRQHSSPAVFAKIHKDKHLVELALASDQRVISLDDNMRSHLAKLPSHLQDLEEILWANPEHIEEHVIEWLRQSAPEEDRRKLKNYPLL